ncbi:uncharacterized protein LOC117332369 [Pecten maximus]|uniref:uncharacterized protein LOC117332369 n=1 Tax=Pecten maximus TaxID=6579 RepID=UPI001458957D|nr:uncharacterized protein LOC117332369 [Pecten maximus]
MRNFCSELITAVVILPVTAGNYRRRQNGSWYYDGTISSMVFFLVFLAVVIIFTVSKNIDIDQDKRLGIVFVLLTVVFVIGMFACVVLGCIVNKHGLNYVVLRKHENSVTKLQLIFLWIFGIVSGLFSGFLVGQQIQCKVFSPNIEGDGGFFWDSRCIFNVITMLFLLTEIIFITYFAQFEMKRSTSIRYVLFILVCANISVWLHSIIIDNETFSERMMDEQFGNNSIIPACLQNGSIGSLIGHSKPVLGPCFLEFFLLSITILFEMWPPAMIRTSNDVLPTYQDVVELNCSVNEETTLLGITETDGNSLSGADWTVNQLVTLVVSIGVGLGCVVGYIVWVIHQGSQMRLVMEWFAVVINSIMIGANLVGFFCLVHYCKPDRIPKPLKVSEYVYMSSAFGIVMIHVCDILTGLLSRDNSSDITLTSYILAIIQDYLQVVFLLHANRCSKSDPHSNTHLLDCVLMFLLVMNFYNWVIDGFILASFPGVRQVEQKVLGSILWSLYHDILLPVGVFYRFSSALEFFMTFRVYNGRL